MSVSESSFSSPRRRRVLDPVFLDLDLEECESEEEDVPVESEELKLECLCGAIVEMELKGGREREGGKGEFVDHFDTV